MSLTFNVWIQTDGCGTMPLNLLTFTEELAVTAPNTLAPITNVPFGGLFMLDVNGQIFTVADGSFSVTGQTISWLSTIYSLQVGDIVVAIYSYMG